MLTKEQKERRTAFCDSIKINGINTLILGGALVFITFLLNNKIEKSKVEESFISEFNKVKAQKIGESWAELNEWEAQISIQLYHYKNYMDKPNKQDSIFTYDLLNKTKGYEKLFKIERNRFWIGEKHYKILGDFGLLVARKQDNYLKFNQDSINILNKLIHQKRVEADAILEEMLNKK